VVVKTNCASAIGPRRHSLVILPRGIDFLVDRFP
jgi:hypothetical protein